MKFVKTSSLKYIPKRQFCSRKNIL